MLKISYSKVLPRNQMPLPVALALSHLCFSLDLACHPWSRSLWTLLKKLLHVIQCCSQALKKMFMFCKISFLLLQLRLPYLCQSRHFVLCYVHSITPLEWNIDHNYDALNQIVIPNVSICSFSSIVEVINYALGQLKGSTLWCRNLMGNSPWSNSD